MNLNSVTFQDLKNKKLNFKKLLNKCDSIIWKECSNLKIRVKSKINKFQFDDCKNITLHIYGSIAGIEINKCTNFKMIIPSDHCISSLQLFKSRIKIKCVIHEFKRIYIIKEQSKISFD